MTEQAIINGLYRELLFVAMILLGILLFNNLVLYKQKLKDRLSLMLLFAVVMCSFEILWTFCEGHPQLKALTYLGVCGYMISFVSFTALLNRYILNRFDRLPKAGWMNVLFYIVPLGGFLLLCVTTPLTHWVVGVDEAGVLHEEVLFDALFTPLMALYLLTALISAVEYAIRGRRNNPTATRIAYNMIVFGVLTPGVYVLEICLLGADSNYLALSLAVSVSLVYLTTNVSTHTLLETRAKVEATESDLRVATRIQADMLPNIFPAFPERPEFDIYASMDPAKEVGGDFYDFFLVDDDHLCMVIADVSGKGVPAALFMMAAKIILQNNAMIGKSPAQILTDANAAICSNNREEMFVTVWLGILELSTGKLTAANAGHEYPVMCKANGQFELIKDKHGFVIGGMDGLRYKEYELQMEPGSKLFLYTDGVPEATDAKQELFGTERMLNALNEDASAIPENILKQVRSSVDGFVKEAEQFDDLTMLCLEYRGGEQDGA